MLKLIVEKEWSSVYIHGLPKTSREEGVRELVTEQLRENQCKKCPISHTGYEEKLGNSGTVTAEQKANLRAIHMAAKSRPMKSLRNFQKRKYGTAPTMIGQHASRRELAIAPIQDHIFESNAEQLESEDCHSADGPNDGSLSASDFVFEI